MLQYIMEKEQAALSPLPILAVHVGSARQESDGVSDRLERLESELMADKVTSQQLAAALVEEKALTQQVRQKVDWLEGIIKSKFDQYDDLDAQRNTRIAELENKLSAAFPELAARLEGSLQTLQTWATSTEAQVQQLEEAQRGTTHAMAVLTNIFCQCQKTNETVGRLQESQTLLEQQMAEPSPALTLAMEQLAEFQVINDDDAEARLPM